MGKVKYILSQPDKIIKSGETDGIVLPAALSNLTVISGRAPSLVKLIGGLVQFVDEPEEKYLIKGGIANIANDVCMVSSEEIVKQ